MLSNACRAFNLQSTTIYPGPAYVPSSCPLASLFLHIRPYPISSAKNW